MLLSISNNFHKAYESQVSAQHLLLKKNFIALGYCASERLPLSFIQCTKSAPHITSSLISKISARLSFRAHGTAHVHLLFNITWKKKTLLQPAQIGNELLSMTFPSLHLLFCQADLLDVLICNFELFWQEQSYNGGANWWTSIFTVSPSRLDRRLKYKNKFQPQIT